MDLYAITYVHDLESAHTTATHQKKLNVNPTYIIHTKIPHTSTLTNSNRRTHKDTAKIIATKVTPILGGSFHFL